MNIYPATDRELDDILEIQNLSYHEIEPESPEVIVSKIYASPDTCFIAKDTNGVRGYLLSLPSTLGNPPQLHSNTQVIEECPNCLYLHDLAIHPNARGLGVGRLLFQHFIKTALLKKFQHLSLISIQNSVPFWEKNGFQVVSANDNLKEKLSTYGKDATYMECDLSTYC